jgi:hypothetical protein
MRNIMEYLETEVLEACMEFRLIPLTQGKFAIVDVADYERLSCYKWCAQKKVTCYYARRQAKGRVVLMHHMILDIPAGMVCDHKNHNGLDNRRSNLRVCTPTQNMQNSRPREGGTSRYKGVFWDSQKRKWRAKIGHNRRLIHIGYFDYEQDAAIAYDDKAVELFGEFACLNLQCRPEIRLWIKQTYFQFESG